MTKINSTKFRQRIIFDSKKLGYPKGVEINKFLEALRKSLQTEN